MARATLPARAAEPARALWMACMAMLVVAGMTDDAQARRRHPAQPATVAEPSTPDDLLAGSYQLSVGAAVFAAPTYEGDDELDFFIKPLVEISATGARRGFESWNDNPSFTVFGNGIVEAGLVGKLITHRGGDASRDIKGLSHVPWGGEAGGFVNVYPADWLRVRAELRQGIRSHDGLVADLAADAFHDLTPAVRISAGPRASFATSGYFDAYYGVNAGEAADTGLAEYHPGGGLRSVGVGGQITWAVTDHVTTSAFLEYTRLLGPAAASSLVRQRGSDNQLLFGVSATYRFDFTLGQQRMGS